MKNEALSTFISTAESLQIKGLTDSDTPSKVPAEVLSPQIITMDAPTVTVSPARPAPSAASRPMPKRVSARAQQQIVVEKQPDSEDSDSEEVPIRAPTIIAGAKRISAAKSSVATVKRMKITAASTPNQSPATKLSTTTTTLTTSKRQATRIEPQPELLKTEEVMIELEQEAEDDEQQQQEEEAQEPLMEDDTYAEMKYDESYFTENDTTTETKPATTSYQAQEQSAGDLSQADNQG